MLKFNFSTVNEKDWGGSKKPLWCKKIKINYLCALISGPVKQSARECV